MNQEHEKCMAGQEYHAENPEYLQWYMGERLAIQAKCQAFNNMDVAKLFEAQALVNEMLDCKGSNFVLSPFMCTMGNIVLGEGTTINSNSYFQDLNFVTFGKKCRVGPNCSFYTASHPTDHEKRADGYMTCKPITLGDNVFIGGSVVVQPGVTIGSNTIIGSGSVVTKDIPNNVFAAGNPCKVIKDLD